MNFVSNVNDKNVEISRIFIPGTLKILFEVSDLSEH